MVFMNGVVLLRHVITFTATHDLNDGELWAVLCSVWAFDIVTYIHIINYIYEQPAQ